MLARGARIALLRDSSPVRPPPPFDHAPPLPLLFTHSLRVFVRLDANAPARNHIGYAIRAHDASKTGLELNKMPQVVQVNTGWPIRAADKTTRGVRSFRTPGRMGRSSRRIYRRGQPEMAYVRRDQLPPKTELISMGTNLTITQPPVTK